jgi:uncharacterized protein (DUF1501 family)
MGDELGKNVPVAVTEGVSRRAFLRQLSALSMTGATCAFAPLALQLAASGEAVAQVMQGGEDYKALVCVFLYGGNDSYNTLVPYDSDSYRQYVRARADIALSRDQLAATVLQPRIPVPGGRIYALAPSLAPLKALFDQGRMAVQLNMGPLVVPTTKADYIGGRVPLPPKLFSHNDQHSYWQGLAAEGAVSGWGGRLADLFVAANGKSAFTTITVGGNALFLSGQTVSAYRVSAMGATPIELLQHDMYGSTACTALLRTLLTQAGPHLFEQHIAATLSRSIHAERQLHTALTGITVPGTFDTPLAAQLQMVARIIAARHTLGIKRQVFFVSQNGYDTHDGLATTHPRLLRELADALTAFQHVMVQLELEDRVTTFTASEFGRTLVSNGDGSDHGWGGHHFICGGAVQGGRFYGTDPALILDGPGFVDSGRLLPSTAVEQFGATLAKWFGVSARQLAEIFPQLHEFESHDVGFMKT